MLIALRISAIFITLVAGVFNPAWANETRSQELVLGWTIELDPTH